MAVAVAKAESGLRTNALGHNSNGTSDAGCFQINSIHCKRLIACADRYDAEKNAKVALQLSYNGTNWKAWSTFKNNSYRKFL